MATSEKTAAVAELKNRFSNSAGAVLTEYRGLSVAELRELRRSLGDDATYAVSKNTLTKIAAHDVGLEGLDEHLIGPTAIAFIDGDPVQVAKGLRNFAKTHEELVIKAGIIDGAIVGAESVNKLADLESRETLLTKMAGAMKGSLFSAAGLFNAPLAQAARAFGALESKAQSEPSVIGGAGAMDTGGPDADQTDTASPGAVAEPDAGDAGTTNN